MEQIFAMGTDQARSKFDALFCTKRSSKDSRPLPLLRKCQECQEEKKDEETVKMNKSKAAVGVTHARRGQSSCTSEQFGA